VKGEIMGEASHRAIGPGTRPKLAAKARVQTDRQSGNTVLLYPEGVLVLNATGAAIVGLCDGSRTIEEMVAELAERFDAPPDRLSADVAAYLARLGDRGLLETSVSGGGRVPQSQ
jgi:pyrroloquinoline quinone biosynthesis protein D